MRLVAAEGRILDIGQRGATLFLWFLTGLILGVLITLTASIDLSG